MVKIQSAEDYSFVDVQLIEEIGKLDAIEKEEKDVL